VDGGVRPETGESFINRELSWLGFARRVLALAEDPDLPLLERVKFAGILGMLHDEFFMKRVSGLKRQVARGSKKLSLDGRQPHEELDACRAVLLEQVGLLSRVMREEVRPAMGRAGIPVHDFADLDDRDKAALRDYFLSSVQPILTPLAVDAEHPFPFISNLGLNLAVRLPANGGNGERFVQIKVPDNRPRWVELPDGRGYVPLEQVIAAHLDRDFLGAPPAGVHLFRVTRGAEAKDELAEVEEPPDPRPGSLVAQVSRELKARRFAGAVRLQIDETMPKKLVRWLAKQLAVDKGDVYPTDYFLGIRDLLDFPMAGHEELRFPPHRPVAHPRLRRLDAREPSAIFDEIARGDVLLHHPYQSFDTSVLRFLEAAAADPQVLAIKVTIYRTSSESPIVQALVDAVRRGKQVAVLVEITARFDEAPNIAWGKLLENEGAHVAYGLERLKTHVKLAMVVREEGGGIRRYAHIGTGNYHTGTARVYEDLGILTDHPGICDDVAKVFNALTGAVPHAEYRHLIVAPASMRERFTALARREAEHARAGRPSGIHAKMNQLQDPDMIRELYAASRAGVPITLNVRGLCCLQPGVPGLSETIRVFGVVGRFLEHSRIYRFTNGGEPELYIGSADWMKRNLDRRVETVTPVLDPSIRAELDGILEVYETDNASVWDCRPDGTYVRRRPAPGEERRAVQEILARRAEERMAEATSAAADSDEDGPADDPWDRGRARRVLPAVPVHRSRTTFPSAEDPPARTR